MGNLDINKLNRYVENMIENTQDSDLQQEQKTPKKYRNKIIAGVAASLALATGGILGPKVIAGQDKTEHPENNKGPAATQTQESKGQNPVKEAVDAAGKEISETLTEAIVFRDGKMQIQDAMGQFAGDTTKSEVKQHGGYGAPEYELVAKSGQKSLYVDCEVGMEGMDNKVNIQIGGAEGQQGGGLAIEYYSPQDGNGLDLGEGFTAKDALDDLSRIPEDKISSESVIYSEDTAQGNSMTTIEMTSKVDEKGANFHEASLVMSQEAEEATTKSLEDVGKIAGNPGSATDDQDTQEAKQLAQKAQEGTQDTKSDRLAGAADMKKLHDLMKQVAERMK